MEMQSIHFDFTSPAFIADPYPQLAEWREQAPCFYDPDRERVFFTRYEDISALLRSRRLGRSLLHALSPEEQVRRQRSLDPALAPFYQYEAHHVMDKEPPDHTRLRGLLGKAFTPQRVEALRPRVASIVDHLLEEAAPAGCFDLVADFAEPLPVTVIAELLGMPEWARPHLRPWSHAIVKLYEPDHTPEQGQAAVRAVEEFSACIRSILAERRSHPQDDLISALAAAEDQGQRLSEEELIANCILLLNAGHEATVNGLASSVLALLRCPDALASFRAADTAPADRLAVEELLRFDTPLPLFNRWVLEDFDYQGLHIERGSQVSLLYASGNRDPRRFEHPDELVLDRKDNPHLTFGLGIHYCLGAPLARLELQVALRGLVRRFPDLRLVSTQVEYQPGFVIRGLKSLAMRS